MSSLRGLKSLRALRVTAEAGDDSAPGLQAGLSGFTDNGTTMRLVRGGVLGNLNVATLTASVIDSKDEIKSTDPLIQLGYPSTSDDAGLFFQKTSDSKYAALVYDQSATKWILTDGGAAIPPQVSYSPGDLSVNRILVGNGSFSSPAMTFNNAPTSGYYVTPGSGDIVFGVAGGMVCSQMTGIDGALTSTILGTGSGTFAIPSLRNFTDPDTGLYFPDENKLGITCGGASVSIMSGSQASFSVGINGTTSVLSGTLSSSGVISPSLTPAASGTTALSISTVTNGAGSGAIGITTGSSIGGNSGAIDIKTSDAAGNAGSITLTAGSSAGVGTSGNVVLIPGTIGTINLQGVTQVVNATVSSGTGSGALVVSGGVGVGGKINAGSIATAGTFSAGGSTLATAIISGSSSAASLAVSGTMSAGASTLSSATVSGTASAQSLSLSASTASTTTGTGALIVTGGIGCGGRINAGGVVGAVGVSSTAPVFGTVTAFDAGNEALYAKYQTTARIGFSYVSALQAWGLSGAGVQGLNHTAWDVSAWNGGGGQGDWDIQHWYSTDVEVMRLDGTQLWIKPTTTSSSTSTGALRVGGGAGIAGAVFAGSITTAGTMSAGASTLASAVVSGTASAQSLSLSASTASTTTSTGALVVTGGIGCGGRINAGGDIRCPRYRCTGLNTSTQTIATGTGTAVTFPTASDVSVNWGGARADDTKFVVPTGGDGFYLITVMFSFAISASATDRSVYIQKNGTGARFCETRWVGQNTSRNSLGIHWSLPLVATDYIQVICFQNTGSNLNAGDSSTVPLSLTIDRLHD